MQAIPKIMLQKKAKHLLINTDCFCNKTYSLLNNLDRVAYFSSQFEKGNAKATMVYDFENSIPKNTQFNVGEAIETNNIIYEITKIAVFSIANKPHHTVLYLEQNP